MFTLLNSEESNFFRCRIGLRSVHISCGVRLTSIIGIYSPTMEYSFRNIRCWNYLNICSVSGTCVKYMACISLLMVVTIIEYEYCMCVL